MNELSGGWTVRGDYRVDDLAEDQPKLEIRFHEPWDRLSNEKKLRLVRALVEMELAHIGASDEGAATRRTAGPAGWSGVTKADPHPSSYTGLVGRRMAETRGPEHQLENAIAGFNRLLIQAGASHVLALEHGQPCAFPNPLPPAVSSAGASPAPVPPPMENKTPDIFLSDGKGKAGFVDGVLYCYGGCGRQYRDFDLDVILPTPLWNRIAAGQPFDETQQGIEREGRGGVLCVSCIVQRLSRLPDVTVAFLTTQDYKAGAPSAPAPVPPLEGWEVEALRERLEHLADRLEAAHTPTRGIERLARESAASMREAAALLAGAPSAPAPSPHQTTDEP